MVEFTMAIKTPPPNKVYRDAYDKIDWNDYKPEVKILPGKLKRSKRQV